jgi:hypothetical protein
MGSWSHTDCKGYTPRKDSMDWLRRKDYTG